MELTQLLNEAETAPADRRIEWRDRIAAYGPRGVAGVQPWLADATLAAFAIRVIERVGSNGEALLAAKVLRSARSRVPALVAADVDWALQRIKAASRTPVAAAAPVRVPTTRPAVRERPRIAGPAPRRQH